MSRDARRPHSPTRAGGIGLALAALLLVGGGAFASLGVALAATSAFPLTGGISGPPAVGEGLNGTYVVTAQGGPAEATNGTQVGIFSYSASLSAANQTGASVLPSQGVLTNGTVKVTLHAPKAVEALTIFVLVTSSFDKVNASQNFSYTVQIVQPYALVATLVAGSGASVAPFSMTVLLDGSPIGAIAVPGLTAGSSKSVAFFYVPSSISPGWHTFTVSLAQEHGLVSFAGGASVYSSQFYVNGPAPNNGTWYLAGATAFLGGIFIWSARLGGRRRGRAKK